MSVALVLGCTMWSRKVNTAARNGVFYGWTTESQCLDACLTSLTCVAIDFGPVGCVLHNNVSDLTTAYYALGVVHFVLNRNCQPSSKQSTESSLASTTFVADTTGM